MPIFFGCRHSYIKIDKNIMIKLSPVHRVKNINATEFLQKYKAQKKPLLIENLTESWPAKEKWSLDYFTQVAGDKQVPLYDCVPSKEHKHQYAASKTMPLKNYLDGVRQGKKDLRLFFYNILAGAPQLIKDFKYPDIGLKFFKKLPVLFIAAKGTKVQMHFDIDYADILLCHFGGKKRVMLFPYEQTKYMYHVPYSFSSLFEIDFDQPDYEKYPALAHLQGEEVELNHGDVLYIPPGYWHYIVYEETGMSMALRAFPRTPMMILKMLRNLLWIRLVEGFMRKLIGQSWNERNARLAVENTNKNNK